MCSLNYVFFFPFYLKYKYNKTFRGGQDCFGPLNGHEQQRVAILWQKKVEAPSKSRDFHGEPREMAQVMAFPAKK